MNIFLICLLGIISISQLGAEEFARFRLMTFNILQGGGNRMSALEMNYLAVPELMKSHLQSSWQRLMLSGFRKIVRASRI